MNRPLPVLALLLATVLGLVAVPDTADAQRLVILVRHAERADGGTPPPGAPTPADPDLSAEGRARAERLADMLAEAGVARVFVTEFKRTHQTADPAVRRFKLPVEERPAADAAGLAARLGTYPDDVVLVVGHSNSVPATIAALGGPKVTIGDADYGNLFIYVPANRTLTRLRF